MTVLSDIKLRKFGSGTYQVQTYPVKAGVKIWAGAHCSVDTNGYAKPVRTPNSTPAGTDTQYIGVATSTVEGGAADGDTHVTVKNGQIIVANAKVNGLDGTAIGNTSAKVYVTDDDGEDATYDYTSTSMDRLAVGFVAGADPDNGDLRIQLLTVADEG